MAEVRQTTIRFGEEVYERLILGARNSGLPINSVVIVACMEWLERHYPHIGNDTAKLRGQRLWKVKTPFSRTQQRNCSFCGKEQSEIQRLIAGPGVYICDQCIALCNEIIAEETSSRGGAPVDDG